MSRTAAYPRMPRAPDGSQYPNENLVAGEPGLGKFDGARRGLQGQVGSAVNPGFST
jgi:hypothetical protein